MIKENELRPAKGAVQKRTRRARGDGSGLGGEAGRGHKGQQSRSGYSYRSGFEGGQMPLYRRLPKKRGTGNRVFKTEYAAINLGVLDQFFTDNETVDSTALAQRGLMGRSEKYKILGVGELTKKLTIKAHKISKSALEKLASSASVYEEIK